MSNRSITIQEMLSGYFLPTIQAVGLLYENRLYGHALVIIHSSIDTLGLLDAPPTQTSASGASYKTWTKKYLLPELNVEFNEVDLWGSRCAVLHTFTSESDSSRNGGAFELQFYSGDKDSEAAQRFVAFTRSADAGRHFPVHWQDFCEAFLSALKAFLPILEANCKANQVYVDRLSKVLQIKPYE